MDIGKRLKTVRQAHGMSQRDLASRAGLTNGTISLIEKNKTSPSIASLKRLLDAFPISMSEFFASVENAAENKVFYKKSEFIEIAPQKAGLSGPGAGLISLRQLGDVSHHALQILYEIYPAHSDTGAEMLSHTGEEAGIVISGQIEITVDSQIETLTPGDGYQFASHFPHRFRNVSDEKCVIVSACTPPSF